MENDETKKEKVMEVYSEVEKLKKESANIIKKMANLEQESIKDWAGLRTEEMELYKFIIKQELKNVDVILNILKLSTSLSISILIASLSTNYFNVNIEVIIGINLISIILLIIFINARNSISLKGKKTLLEILEKSTTTTCNTMLVKSDGIKLKINNNKKELKEQKKIFNNLKK